MSKLVIVMAIVASVCFVEAVAVPVLDPMSFVSGVVGFDVNKMIKDSVASIQAEDGVGTGTIVTNKEETVIEDGVPVKKYVTRYKIIKDGKVVEGVL